MKPISSGKNAGHYPGFFEELQRLRWDDHRYYHHSRINQSLHFLSASCFLACYALVFINPGLAALLGWVVAMWLRQIGHFFFEPKSYDDVNAATHDHKEEIKVGYNLRRKRILQSIWAVSPLILYFNKSLFGLLPAYQDVDGFIHNLAIMWLWLGIFALLVRTVHLFIIENVQTGMVWATKILTDPFNDFKIYCKSPLHLMKGELIDPMIHVRHELEEAGRLAETSTESVLP